MPQPENYVNESGRIESLKSYSILDTLPEEDYDNLTAIAASICNTPVSLVTLIDVKRQWFKSNHGLDINETAREFAFCAHAINDSSNILTVGDTRTDERFKDNPFVTGEPKVIFYAGVPLVNFEGFALGTLCVIDHKPRKLTNEQIAGLKALAKQVMNLLELRRMKQVNEETLLILNQKNEDLERFAYVAAHDLKTPVVNIITMGRLFQKLFGHTLDDRGEEIMSVITDSAGNLSSLVDGLLDYSRCDKILQEKKQVIYINDIKKEIATIFGNNAETKITINTTLEYININKTALSQILTNLVSNAVKYSNKEKTEIGISITAVAGQHQFCVQDNGPGIPSEYHTKIFTIFEVFSPEDRYGNRGNGLGLATVKKLIDKMGGEIEVKSLPQSGTCFNFTIPF
jgi:signal transduction histidine kinase